MKRCALLLLLVLLVSACGKKRARVAHLPPPPGASGDRHKPAEPKRASSAIQLTDDDLYGYASWYGHPYHGRATTSGEIYNMHDFTAAHRTIPFGARVEVTNMENGRQVQVRINDRGPFVDGRIIDLSYAAARAVDMIGPGTALVRLNVLDVPAEALLAGARYGVQVGAFREPSNAERLRRQLANRHTLVSVRHEGELYHVYVGAEPSEAAAGLLAQQLRRENLFGMVVLLP